MLLLHFVFFGGLREFLNLWLKVDRKLLRANIRFAVPLPLLGSILRGRFPRSSFGTPKIANSELSEYLYGKRGDSYRRHLFCTVTSPTEPTERCLLRLRMVSNSPGLPRLQQQMRMIPPDRMTQTNIAKKRGAWPDGILDEGAGTQGLTSFELSAGV
ncbi:hypothetical protein BDR22DRAFT_823786 [Usnea florida]